MQSESQCHPLHTGNSSHWLSDHHISCAQWSLGSLYKHCEYICWLFQNNSHFYFFYFLFYNLQPASRLQALLSQLSYYKTENCFSVTTFYNMWRWFDWLALNYRSVMWTLGCLWCSVFPSRSSLVLVHECRGHIWLLFKKYVLVPGSSQTKDNWVVAVLCWFIPAVAPVMDQLTFCANFELPCLSSHHYITFSQGRMLIWDLWHASSLMRN